MLRLARILIVSVILHATTAHAVPLTLDFQAINASNITLTGSINYESTQSPSALNIMPPLSPNAAYDLSAWSVAINVPIQFSNLLPPLITMSSGLAGNTGTLCLGQCIFASPQIETLFFKDDLHTLRLSFELAAPTPFTAPPSTPSQWGAFIQGDLETVTSSGAFSSLVVFNTGGVTSLQSSVPEPSSVLLLILGLGAILFYERRRGATTGLR